MSIVSFVQILIEALVKKEALLNNIQNACNEQDLCLKMDIPDIAKYSQYADVKSDLSKEIEKIDEGFLSVYERIKDELETNASMYADQIRRMKALVASITEKTNSINVKEQRLNAEIKKRIGVNSSQGKIGSTNSIAAQRYASTMKGNSSLTTDATFINSKK